MDDLIQISSILAPKNNYDDIWSKDSLTKEELCLVKIIGCTIMCLFFWGSYNEYQLIELKWDNGKKTYALMCDIKTEPNYQDFYLFLNGYPFAKIPNKCDSINELEDKAILVKWPLPSILKEHHSECSHSKISNTSHMPLQAGSILKSGPL